MPERIVEVGARDIAGIQKPTIPGAIKRVVAAGGGVAPPNKPAEVTRRHGKFNDPSGSSKFKKNMRMRRKVKEVTPEMHECLSFLTSTVGKPEQEIRQLIKDFPLKDKLLQLVDHIIATGMGGWKQSGKILVNESGHEASLENWELVRGGRIKPLGYEKPYHYDVDKLLKIRSVCDE